MLSLRANTGTNWPPPPFFLSASPSLYLFLHIYVSPPLLVAAPSFSSPPLLNPLSLFFSHCPPISHSFFFLSLLIPSCTTAPPPFVVSLSPLFAWCSVGEPRGREIIQSLCILQALWSVAEPRCTDTLVYLDWPSKQPTPWQIAWMLLLPHITHTHTRTHARTHTRTHTHTHTHTHAHTHRKNMQNTHSAVCGPGSMRACGADSFKEISNQKEERKKTNESGKGERE